MQLIFQILESPLPDSIMTADVLFLMIGIFGVGIVVGHRIGKGNL